MKRFIYTLIVLLLAAPAATAQIHHVNQEALDMADQFVTNYDSLLNSYVISKYSSTSRRHHANIKRLIEGTEPDFKVGREKKVKEEK